MNRTMDGSKDGASSCCSSASHGAAALRGLLLDCTMLSVLAGAGLLMPPAGLLLADADVHAAGQVADSWLPSAAAACRSCYSQHRLIAAVTAGGGLVNVLLPPLVSLLLLSSLYVASAVAAAARLVAPAAGQHHPQRCR